MAIEAMPGNSRDLKEEIIALCDSTREMLLRTWEGFRRHDNEKLKEAEIIGRQIHLKEKELTASIMNALSESEGHIPGIGGLIFIPGHLERIGDNVEHIIVCIRTMTKDGVHFSERAMKETNTLFDKTIELVECVRDALKTKNKVLGRYIKEEGIKLQDSINEYSLAHQERLIVGTCLSKASSVYLAILDYLADIERHTRKIADNIQT